MELLGRHARQQRAEHLNRVARAHRRSLSNWARSYTSNQGCSPAPAAVASMLAHCCLMLSSALRRVTVSRFDNCLKASMSDRALRVAHANDQLRPAKTRRKKRRARCVHASVCQCAPPRFGGGAGAAALGVAAAGAESDFLRCGECDCSNTCAPSPSEASERERRASEAEARSQALEAQLADLGPNASPCSRHRAKWKT
jgi:hypothetical protein